MRAALKIAAFIPLAAGYVFAVTLAGLPFRGRLARLRAQIRITSRFAKFALWIFGIRVAPGSPVGSKNGKRMIVSNHLSYVDVLVIAAAGPTVFVTSGDVRRTPVLGTLAALGGSVFVERRRVDGLKAEIRKIATLLRAGFTVCIFPEATSTDGTRVLPFKTALFDAARRARVPIVPACIRYPEIDGRPFSAENRDCVCYYGDMTFAGHFAGFVRAKEIRAEFIPLTALGPNDARRTRLGQISRERIAQTYFTAPFFRPAKLSSC